MLVFVDCEGCGCENGVLGEGEEGGGGEFEDWVGMFFAILEMEAMGQLETFEEVGGVGDVELGWGWLLFG